jgi:hypothetical protein
MSDHRKIAAGIVGLVAGAGLAIQLWLSLRIASVNGKTVGAGLVSYFGYFTILTNLFVALAATLPLVAPASRPGRWFARTAVFGCAVTAIAGVGISYHLLLRQVWNPQGWQWVADMTLHYAVPILTLAHWTVFPPKESVSWKWPLLWCAYPAGYLIYALVRGAAIHSYPYYFIDAAALGYGRVLVHALGLFVVFTGVGAIVIWIGSVRRPEKG